MTDTQLVPTIGEASRFYGYITGIGVERCPGPLADDPVPSRLYASFEYHGETTVWCVPDPELFAILSGHLLSMAAMRSQHHSYGYSKLWIGREGGRWQVDLP